MVCSFMKVDVQPPPFPRPPQCNRFKLRARIPLQAFNNNQQSLFAHAVKSV